MHWFQKLFFRRRRYAELSGSIREHLAEKVEDLMDGGMSQEEALRTARHEFGNVTVIEERSREIWQWPKLESIWSDLRYALRKLRRSPVFTITAFLTLALGIGANTGIFTLLNAVLLKSLPVPHPEQLFLVKANDLPAEHSRFSYPLFRRLQRDLPDSAPIAAMSWTVSFLMDPGTGLQERAAGQLVSDNYFQVFETHPVLGRLLTPDDDSKANGSAVTVISYRYWQTRFNGDPTAVGRKIYIHGVPFTIVGVAARGFFGARAGSEPDLWLPATEQSEVRYADHYSDSSPADPSQPWIPQENIHWVQFVIRVKNPAVVPEMMAVLNQQYREGLKLRLHTEEPAQASLKNHLALEPGQKGFATLRRTFEQPLLLLMGMAVMVLLIACANIANLLLARAFANQRAIAVQLSMGAGRARLVRQTLTECLLLSTCGGVLGIAVAFWLTAFLPQWASSSAVPIPLNLTPDARVLSFSVLVIMATGVLFGLAPALQGARVEPVSVLKSGARGISGNGGGSRWSLRKTLIASQVALSLVFLIGAAMFIKTLSNYGKLNPGFDRRHILSVYVDTHAVGYQKQEYLPLYQQLIDRLDAIPGVRSSSVATCGLAQGCLDTSGVVIAGEGNRNSQTVMAQENSVSLDYFTTVGMYLLGGRGFKTTDNADSPKVAVINQTFARRFLTGGATIGRRFSYTDSKSESFEIVGIVTDARVNDIREMAPPLIYFPIAQRAGDISSVDIRTAADPEGIARQVRQTLTKIDPRLPIMEISTLSDQVNQNLTQERLIARLTTIFGALALSLSCLGLYGVMSYTVQRRTSELGIRLALGSPRSIVLWLVAEEALSIIGSGVFLGLVLSIPCMRLATGFLFGLSPEDPTTICLAVGVLFLVSIAAAILPAWRASHVSPTEALRCE